MFGIILEQNIMLFIYLIIGYLLAKFKKINQKTIEDAGFFLSNIALTCAIFNSFQTTFSQEKLVLICQSLGMGLLFILFSIVFSFFITSVLNIKRENRAIWRGCCIFSNILFIGIPIVDSLYGETGLIVLVSFNTIYNFFLFGMGESFFLGKVIFSWKKIAKTPAILGMIIGIILFILDIQLPVFVGEPIRVLASFTAPLSMLLNGAMFYGTSFTKLIKNKDILLFCMVRLLLIPLISMVIFRPIIKIEILYLLIVLLASMPSGSMNTIFAEKYRGKGQLASNFIILSTLFSLMSIPLMLTLSQFLINNY